MAQKKAMSNIELVQRQQAAARAVQHAEIAIGQYGAALRELSAATGEPISWAPSISSLKNITLGVARNLDADLCEVFKKAIDKL